MIKYIKKTSIVVFILIFALNFSSLLYANIAGATMWTEVNKQMSGLATKSGYLGTENAPVSIESVVANIIQYVLSFLGVIFITLIIYAGFLWMTASGDSEKITKAKDILISAVIGITIVLSAYIITTTILAKLGAATGT